MKQTQDEMVERVNDNTLSIEWGSKMEIAKYKLHTKKHF